jgi:hypothetical protein
LSPLLTASEVYTASMEHWNQAAAESPPVVLGFSGRLVSVTTNSRNAASAFKLIPWLTSGEAGTKLSQRSQATLWCRASQMSKAATWLGGKADDDTARWLSQQLSRGDAYLLPRILGIDRYLTELEIGLRRGLTSEQPNAGILAELETKWNALTDALGRDEQRRAFNQHLGLSE